MVENKEEKFHKERIAFIIIDQEIKYLFNSVLSHKDWCEQLGIQGSSFDQLIRGYVKENKIVYYYDDFLYDEKTIEVALSTYRIIMNELNMQFCEVYCGVKKGKIGEVWDLCVKVAEEKLVSKFI